MIKTEDLVLKQSTTEVNILPLLSVQAQTLYMIQQILR